MLAGLQLMLKQSVECIMLNTSEYTIQQSVYFTQKQEAGTAEHFPAVI